jgi:hypothetical protein
MTWLALENGRYAHPRLALPLLCGPFAVLERR